MIFVFIITIVGCIILAFWTLFLVKFPSRIKSIANHNLLPKVSVVIAFKNEEANLRHIINSILVQEYPNFEVIVIDDHSRDRSLEIAQSIQSGKLKVLQADANQYGKKNALQQAIKESSGSIIVCTDADCKISSSKWLGLMCNGFEEIEHEIVLGYSPMLPKKQNVISYFSIWETIMTAFQYFSMARIGLPYMGVGRNIAYRKKVFEQNNGFESHMDILSGDDDLFIQENADAHNVYWQIDPKSFVYTTSVDTVADYIRQKVRHVSTAQRYQWKHKMILIVYATSNWVWWVIGLIILLIGEEYLYIYLCATLIKWVYQMIVNYILLQRLEQNKWIWFFPIFDILQIAYYPTIAITSLFMKRKW